MNKREMTLSEIQEKGHRALLRELGPEGYIRFWQHYRAGEGDYTKERRQWVDKLTLEEIVRQRPEK
jgi:hypothetical protein